MAIIVIGGHSRSVGKTSVVEGIIAALPNLNWTSFKITQFGHGICSANGKPCDCDPGQNQCDAISEERNWSGDSDTSRFLAAGAVRSLWVRTRQGSLEEVMPRIHAIMAEAENVIIESNSVMRFLRPDLYLCVLDFGIEDFKDSAREFLGRADGIILHKTATPARWKNIPLDAIAGKPIFRINPPPYVTDDIVKWIQERTVDSRVTNVRGMKFPA